MDRAMGIVRTAWFVAFLCGVFALFEIFQGKGLMYIIFEVFIIILAFNAIIVLVGLSLLWEEKFLSKNKNGGRD